MAEEGKSFWSSAQGLVTAAAGLIFALTGAYEAWQKWRPEPASDDHADVTVSAAPGDAASEPGDPPPDKSDPDPK